MASNIPSRLLNLLPGIYRDGDADLARLLSAFEELLFDGQGEPPQRLPGIARELDALPAVFAPLGLGGPSEGGGSRSHDRFLPWLATWLAFAPHDLVEPERLRYVIAGIVPLYGRRGTRAFLEELLRLCFEEIEAVRVDETGVGGLRVGESKLGIDSYLTEDRPFWFRVEVNVAPSAPLQGGTESTSLEQRLRAIIDFAKPAHTAYELKVRRAPAVVSEPGRT